MNYNREVISATRRAHARYRQRLEERQKEEAEKADKVKKDEAEKQKQLDAEKKFQEKKRRLKETEADLKEHDEHQSKLKAAEALLSETNQRLAYAVNSRDFEKVTVAQGLLEVAHKKMKVAQEEMEDWQKRRAAVDSKRMKMIDNAKL